jgi:hypothetical protein
MAIKFVEGFDLYDTAAHLVRKGWSLNSGTPFLTTGRFGGQCVNISNSTVQSPAFTAGNNWAMGFAFEASSLSSYGVNGKRLVTLTDGSSQICALYLCSTGKLIFGRTDSTTNAIASSATGIIAAASWNYIEFELVRNATTGGSVNVYANGTLVANASATNTGSAAPISFQFMNDQDGGNVFFDDMYICDVATKLGECRVDTLRPGADTATKQFTPNSGANNFSRVNTTLFDDDTTYNSDLTVGHKDLFDIADLSFTPVAVKAVQLTMLARKDDVTTKQIRTNMKTVTSTTNGATQTLTTSYALSSDIYETNPDTSAAFTGSEVNALQIGYEIVT